ncbi:NAD-dependent epimerase/dehydratase family protein [Candidatus Saccharibacteria bacterium]|nr:NAD-dependent epimerase/dehydratase family protein [Candidatus Saccharibacteria bacterium]
MRIAVFGADGFLGRHLVARLSEVTGNEIIAFDRFNSLARGEMHAFDKLGNVKQLAGDFFNRDDVHYALEGVDIAFHLVSTTNPAVSLHDPLIEVDTNIRASVEFLLSCKNASVGKVVHFSSGGTVYGNVSSKSIKETSPLEPISPYAIAKVTIENFLRYFHEAHGIEYLVYRIANPYGPGQNIHGKQGVIPIFMKRYLENEPIDIYGTGEMVRDYIYIDDLMNMILASYNQQTAYSIYNLGSGEGHTILDIIDAIEKCTPVRPVKNHLPVPLSFVEHNVLNIERFNTEFGVQPKTTLKEGTKKMWEYVSYVS